MREEILVLGGAVLSKLYASAVVFGTSWLLGGWDLLAQLLLAAIALDTVTGLILAWYEGRLNSKKMWLGLIRKCWLFVLLMVAVSLDHWLGTVPALRTLAVSFLLVLEGWSVLRNLYAIRVHLYCNHADDSTGMG